MSRSDAERLAALLDDGREDGEQELVGLACLARALESSASQPSPPFKAALRARVLTRLAGQPPQPTWRDRAAALGETFAAWRSSASSLVASGALTVLVLVAGLFVGTNLSLPGDPLYVIKDAYQQEQVSRASAPADAASMQLRMAGAKIDDAVRAAERGRDDSVTIAARDADEFATDGAQTLLTIFSETGDESLVAHLGLFVRHYQPVVAGLHDRVEAPEARSAVADLRATLDRMGEQLAAVLGGCCPIDATEAHARSLLPADEQPTLPPPGSPDREQAADAGGTDDAEPVDHTGGDAGPEPRDEPPSVSGDSRERLRSRLDGTREAVEDLDDGLRGTVAGDEEPVRDTVEDVRDTVDGEGLGDAVEETTEGLADTVEQLLDGSGENESDEDRLFR